jgi:hypothetical protein
MYVHMYECTNVLVKELRITSVSLASQLDVNSLKVGLLILRVRQVHHKVFQLKAESRA